MNETPGDPGDIYSQIPLFREIQRVLMSSAGPVNWELARQVAIAGAVAEGDDPAPSLEDRRELEDAVRIAELQVAELTGLSSPGGVVRIEAVRRSQWVEASIAALKGLIEPSASKVQEAFGKMLPEGSAEGGDSQDPLMMTSIGQMAPLLLGAQVGTVIGYLAQNVMGRSDVPVPPEDNGGLSFVASNIHKFEKDWGLPPLEFRLWVAIHEVTHRFSFARPWTREHLLRSLSDFTSTLDPDLSGLRNKMEGMDPSDPSAMQAILGGDEGLFETVLDDEQRLKLARIQAFVASAEGYGDHVTHTLGRKLLGSYGQISEAMLRHRETEDADPVFERLLGIEVKREHLQLGREFCDRVASETSEDLLARMWDSPESLPSMPELSEPTLWMARTP
jgi:putative hydrolase